jgi:Ca-activated chloride channel family protein
MSIAGSGARLEFESAQIDAPEQAFIPYNIATTYLLEGNFDEAQRHYERAKGMSTDRALLSKIAYNLGHISFYRGNRPEAIEHFKECLRLTPNDEDAKYNIEYIRAGKTPKQPPPQSQKNDQNSGGNSQDQQSGADKKTDKSSSDQDKKQSQAKKDAEENADRILQMMDEQEKEKLRNTKPIQMGKPKKDEQNVEDW